jgi:hypothetical protein
MSTVRDESPPSRIELAVLACLSQARPPSDVELGEAVHQLALPQEPAEAARQRAVQLLAALVGRGWVLGDDAVPRRGRPGKASSPRRLTEAGKRALRNAFHLPRTPSWAQVRDRHLPSLALGVAPGSELAGAACTETALIAAVLGARFGISDARSPLAVCDALIAEELGMPAGKLTLDGLRAHVLLRGIDSKARDLPSPDARGYAGRLAAWIACTAVGASGPQRKMARALARRWVCGEVNPLGVVSARRDTGRRSPGPAGIAGAPEGATRAPGPGVAGGPERTALPGSRTAQPPAPNLLDVVRDTIPRIGEDGRFGEKVYVSAIWRTLARDRKAGELSLDHFKRWLVAANRDGWLVLARADLIGAMDARQVTESEIHDRGATFHFVLDQRNGASMARQDSHAG